MKLAPWSFTAPRNRVVTITDVSALISEVPDGIPEKPLNFKPKKASEVIKSVPKDAAKKQKKTIANDMKGNQMCVKM